MASPFDIGQTYSFNTLAPAFLGSAIAHAKLLSIMDANTARKFEAIDQKFAQIYPTLPVGTPTDVNSVMYYLFQQQNGTNVVIADPWIDKTSIELIELITITATVARASLSDVDKVRIALSSAGITDFTVNVT